MRILCLTPWLPAWPGAQSGNFILDSLLSLQEQGHELTTLVCQPWHPAWGGLLHADWGHPLLRPELHEAALRVALLRYPSIPRNYCRMLSLWLCKRRLLGPLRKHIAAFKPQVLLVHTEQLAIVATLAARPFGIPVVLVVHGVNTSARLNTPAEQLRMREVLQAVDRIVLVGEPLWTPLAALAGSTARFRIVQNGVRLPPSGLKQTPSLSRRPLRLISVSNLVEGKGVDLNLEALARIDAEGFTEWHYTVVGDGSQTAAFVGDTLFMPDYGTARCDFPGGDARTLFRSINKVLALPPETLLYMCHDYQPGGREVQYVSSVADERASNVHVRNGISEEAFVAMRTARDATLGMPTLILPSVQVNMRAGQLPEPESNGIRYIKIPLNAV
jgi:glycosyltransferase involved in cell wall biosynthesis